VAEAIAQARSREEHAHTLGGTVEAIGQHPSDPIGRLLVDRRALELLIGLGQGNCTGLLGVLSQSWMLGQDPQIGWQEFNGLQMPTLLKKQLCDRTAH